MGTALARLARPTDYPMTKSKISLTFSITMIAATTVATRGEPARGGERAELAAAGGEHDQRDDREGQLQAEDHLADRMRSFAVPLSP